MKQRQYLCTWGRRPDSSRLGDRPSARYVPASRRRRWTISRLRHRRLSRGGAGAGCRNYVRTSVITLPSAYHVGSYSCLLHQHWRAESRVCARQSHPLHVRESGAGFGYHSPTFPFSTLEESFSGFVWHRKSFSSTFFLLGEEDGSGQVRPAAGLVLRTRLE